MRTLNPLTCVVAGLATLIVSTTLAQAAEPYDPLAVPAMFKPNITDLTVNDQQRKRELPIRVYLPSGTEPAPVVIFSHGLGGNREGNAYMGKHWSARGYAVVFLQHPGSDDGVWKDQALGKRFGALQDAASLQNVLLRLQDVPAALNQLETWNSEKGHALAGRLNLKQVGMCGHSFGALTTQAVSGQSLPTGEQRFTDSRIKAAIAFSPSSPQRGTPEKAFGNVKLPWLLMTGTKDTSRIGGQTVESRLAVYPALPAGSKYQLVLNNAEHSAFTDRALPGDVETRNANHHKAILAISTAFWDDYLTQNKAAATWLDGSGPRSVLETADKWETK